MRVVVRAPNWLGDAVMALPALAAARTAWARERLAVAAPDALAPLFHAVPGVDEVLALPGSLRGEIAAMRAGRFDLALLFPNSFRAAFTAWRAGVGERWGYRTDGRGGLLTRGVSPRAPGPAAPPAAGIRRLGWLWRRRGRPVRHQAEYYLNLVRALGLTSSPIALPEAARWLVPPAAVRARGEELLRTHGADVAARLVGVAPGAAYGQAKRWPPTRYAALALRLWKERGVQVVLVGAASDRDAGRAIESEVRSALVRPEGAAGPGREARRTPPPVVNLVGRTDVLTLLGVLAACRAVVSNDSGAMHVAAALGVPVVALFGPTDERVTAPLGPHRLVTHPVWCRPCLLRECPIDHRCMTGIAVERVWEALVPCLGESPTR